MSRGTLPYVAEEDIIMERSPTDIRMYGCIICGTTRPEQTRPKSAAVEALTRKGGNDRRKGNCKGKDHRDGERRSTTRSSLRVRNESTDTSMVGRDTNATTALTRISTLSLPGALLRRG